MGWGVWAKLFYRIDSLYICPIRMAIPSRMIYGIFVFVDFLIFSTVPGLVQGSCALGHVCVGSCMGGGVLR